MKASLKRLIILVITVFVLGLGISAGNFAFRAITGWQPEPEPEPEPVYQTPDTGPALESLEVLKTKAFSKGEGRYDVLIEFYNSNPEHGAEEINYSISFLSSGGDEVKKINERTYILPAETKYIVLVNVESPFFSRVEADIQSVTWRKLQEFVRLDLDVFDLKLERLGEENNFYARLAAFVKNNSVFGLTDIRVFGVLFDSAGEEIAVNRTSIQTVLEGEMREVEMFWPNEISLDSVAKFEVYAYSNVMKNENFVRQFGVEEPVRRGPPEEEAGSRNYFQLPELFDNFQGWSPF